MHTDLCLIFCSLGCKYCYLKCYSYVPGNITKKLPRRTIVPVSDTVIFCVELEHPCPDAYWTRNGEKLKQDSRTSIACVLRQYTLTIKDCQADDSGEVAFIAGDCKTSTRFSVTGESIIFTIFLIYCILQKHCTLIPTSAACQV